MFEHLEVQHCFVLPVRFSLAPLSKCAAVSDEGVDSRAAGLRWS